MQYKSPIPLILHAGFAKETLDVATVLKIQKRLLVELDHSGTGYVQVGEQQFTKDDILTVTGEIKDVNTLNFHNGIFDNPELLQLLEHGTVTDGQRPLFSNTLRWIPHFLEFRDFVSPFLVQSVSKGISQSIQKKDFAAARKFLQTKDLITDSDFDLAFAKVKPALELIVHEIERTTEKQIAFSALRFNYIRHHFIDFMNELPDGLAELRDDLAIAFVNMSVTLLKNARTAGVCNELYVYLKLLNCSESLKTLIRDNADIISDASESSESVKQGSGSSLRGIAKVVFIFLSLIALLRICSSRSNQGSSINHGISKTESEHYFFEQALRSIALRSITVREWTPKRSDSVKSLIVQPRAELENDDQPYASRYGDLREYRPPLPTVVHLTNRSQLDAIVFVRNDEYAFSAFLHQKETMAIQMTDYDRLSFYFGNNWNDKFRIDVKIMDSPQDLHGIFENVDSTTVYTLTTYYRFDCDSLCDPVHVELKSSDQAGFVFEADRPELFNWEKGLYSKGRGRRDH